MPGPRVPVVAAGLCLAVFALVPNASALGKAASPPAVSARPALITVGSLVGTATFADGSGRTELPWLLPGEDDPAVSPDGRHVAFSSARNGDREIYVADAATRRVRRLTTNPGAEDRRPAWSPDGKRIAWQSGRPAAADLSSFDLHVMRADGRTKRLLVGGAGDDVEPAWSPDGSLIAFASDRGGHFDLWAAPAKGGEPQMLLDVRGAARAPAWSRDGSTLAYTRRIGGRTDVWVARLDDMKPRRLTRSRASELRPVWSPDGRRIAFVRSGGGRSRIWVVRPDGSGARPVADTHGDTDLDWAFASSSLAPGPEQLLPELDQQAPRGLVAAVVAGRYVLGFVSAVDNLGRGPIRIRGARPAGRATMTASQVIELRGGGTRIVPDVGRLRYEAHPPHHHWHFQSFERYELRRASDYELVGRDRKSGFCLVDRYGLASVSVPDLAPPRFIGDCGAKSPQLRRVEQGSSPGYVDRYPALFHGQDIDLTGIPAGEYVLVHRANPDSVVRERRYSNNAASLRLRLVWPAGREAPPVITVLRRCGASERCP